MSREITNIDAGNKRGAYEPNGSTTSRVTKYFAPGSRRQQRLDQMSVCLFKLGLRSSTGRLPNPLAYAIGSNNRGARLHMIESAKTEDPM
jgi:hypothetical protein